MPIEIVAPNLTARLRSLLALAPFFLLACSSSPTSSTTDGAADGSPNRALDGAVDAAANRTGDGGASLADLSLSEGDAGQSSGDGAMSGLGVPTPTLFVLTDPGAYVPAPVMGVTGHAPFAVHVSAVPPVTDHPCFWDPTTWLADGELDLCGNKAKLSNKNLPANVISKYIGDPKTLAHPVNLEGGMPEACFVQPYDPATAALVVAIAACIRTRDIAFNEQVSNSYLGGGAIHLSNMQWDFGDPGTPYDKVPGLNAAHLYDKPGVYTVQLIVTNEGGFASAPVPLTVTVLANDRQSILLASDADLPKAADNGPASPMGRDILFQRGATFHTPNGFHLRTLDHVGSYSQTKGVVDPVPMGALPILVAGSGNLFESQVVNGISHIVVEQLMVMPSVSGAGVFSTLAGYDIAYREIQYPNIFKGFDIAGSGMLIESVGIPPKLDGTWVASPLKSNFSLFTAIGMSFYGNFVYPNTVAAGEPLVRSNAGERMSLYDNDIGGRTFKMDSVSFREAKNVYFGGNRLRGGNLDLQNSISQDDIPSYLINNGIVENNAIENSMINLDAGDLNISLRNNLFHMHTANDPFSTPFPIDIQVSITLNGGPGYGLASDHIALVNNTFIFDPAEGKALWFDNGNGQDFDLINNLFLTPLVVPVNVSDGLTRFNHIEGNLYFLPKADSAISLVPNVQTITEWNKTVLPNGSAVNDSVLLTNQTGFVVSPDGDPAKSFQPPANAAYAADGLNLTPPAPMAGGTDWGVVSDYLGRSRPAHNGAGWTPGALQAP